MAGTTADCTRAQGKDDILKSLLEIIIQTKYEVCKPIRYEIWFTKPNTTSLLYSVRTLYSISTKGELINQTKYDILNVDI